MTNRNGYVEFLRFFGAVGIIYFHQGAPNGWIGHSALIVFIIISVIFASNSLGAVWKRTRVLEIWLFWSAMYAILKAIQALANGQPVLSEFAWWMLLTGPVLPLWYLPFIYFACVLAQRYLTILSRPSAGEAISLCLALLLCVVASQNSVATPIPQWIIGIGASISAVTIIRGKTKSYYIWILMFGLAFLYLITGFTEVRMYMIGVLLCSLAFNWLPKWESKLAVQLGSLSLGLYVIHPGVAALVGQFFEFTTLFSTVVVVVTSSALTLALKNIPYAKRYI